MVDDFDHTALHIAVTEKDLDMVKLLVVDKKLLTMLNSNGETALHLAIHDNATKIAEELISADSKRKLLRTASLHGDNTALHLMVILGTGNLEILELMTKADQDHRLVRMRNKGGRTALNLAVAYEQFEVLKHLLKPENADKEMLVQTYGDQYTALHMAVEFRLLDAVKLLLEADQDKELMRKTDIKGDTALHWAVHKHFLDGRLLLIEADPNKDILRMSNVKTVTALHLAMTYQYLDMVEILAGEDKELHMAVEKKDEDAVKHLLTKAGNDKELLCKRNEDGYTALHLAIHIHCLDAVKLLIKVDNERKMINMVDKKKNTALHLAVQEKHLGFVNFILIATGQDREFLCKLNNDGYTALHVAMKNQQLDIVDLLIETDKLLVRKGDINQNTALHLAVKGENREAVRRLLTKADHDKELAMITNNQKETALQFAIRMEFLPIVNLFIQVYPKDVLVGMLDENKNTILHLAVQSQNLEIVEAIAVGNEELVTICNEQNNTALHTAVELKQVDMVEYFIREHSAEKPWTIINKDDDTALHLTVQNSFLEAVQTLISADRNYNYGENKAGKTPLYMAVENGSPNIVKEILACPNPNYSGPNGDTALRKALISGNSDIRNWLLEKHRHQCEVQGEDGLTPLQYAASVGNLSGVKDIIESFPDCSKVVDKDGRNFIHIAAKNQHAEVLKYASESNQISDTEMNKKDKFGYTPFHIAAETNIKELVETLLYNNRVIKKTKNAKGEQALAGITFDYDKNRARASSIRDKVNEKELQEQSAFDLVVCALISTLSFMAGITVPGGYNSDTEKPYKGRAILIGDQMFKGFVLSNTCALMFSLSALFSHFCTKRPLRSNAIHFYMTLATYCTLLALFSMMVAFITGSFTVLSVSKGLAFAVLGICSVFIIFALSTIGYVMLEYNVPTISLTRK